MTQGPLRFFLLEESIDPPHSETRFLDFFSVLALFAMHRFFFTPSPFCILFDSALQLSHLKEPPCPGMHDGNSLLSCVFLPWVATICNIFSKSE